MHLRALSSLQFCLPMINFSTLLHLMTIITTLNITLTLHLEHSLSCNISRHSSCVYEVHNYTSQHCSLDNHSVHTYNQSCFSLSNLFVKLLFVHYFPSHCFELSTVPHNVMSVSKTGKTVHVSTLCL